MSNEFHHSVLLKEVIAFLDVKRGGKYIDATLGGGGHTQEILAKGGLVLGIDRDPEAIKFVNETIKSSNLTTAQGSFENLGEIAGGAGFLGVDGILFDLGVSSHQLDSPERGFSIRNDGPLDMRMDPSLGVRARDLINALNEGELTELFTKYGEENWAKLIAKRIVSSRLHKIIETTGELSQLIEQTVGFSFSRGKQIHPATRVFQALRIAVNDEINSLKTALPQALELLSPDGSLVVISFHSLEDRIVKNFFKDMETLNKLTILTPKPVESSSVEIGTNPRSRSAKLRAAQKK